MRGRRATPLPGCLRSESMYCWTSIGIELCRWFGCSSLLKNLHCFTHFCNSEDHERCIAAGIGSAVAVVDVDSGFAEPRCGARQLPSAMGKIDLRDFGLGVISALVV